MFRRWRQTETLGLYSAHFDTFVPIFDHLIDQLPSLAENSPQAKTIADLLHNRNEWTAFRYLAAPPVSEDDLKTLSDSTLAGSNLRADADEARRVGDVVLRAIDPHRFPWIVDHRVANETEKTIAVVASAVLVVARKVETARRGDAKRLQESGVKNLLRDSGLREVATPGGTRCRHRRRVQSFESRRGPSGTISPVLEPPTG